MLLDMIDDKTVRGEQFQLAAGFHRLQRPYPGAEIAGRDFMFKLGQTIVPNSAHCMLKMGI